MSSRLTASSFTTLVSLGIGLILLGPLFSKELSGNAGEKKATLSQAAAEMSEAASNFLASLNPDQLRRAVYNFHDEERRNWHFRPVPRRGVYIDELNTAQRYLAHALASSGLSARGHQKALTIMSLEQVLLDLGEPSNQYRNPAYYSVTIFTDTYNPGNSTWRKNFPNGKGSSPFTGSWAWRIEGFHLSINFTIVDGEAIAATPSFFGSVPGIVKEGPHQGMSVLRSEQEFGRELIKSLNPAQLKTATCPLHKGYMGHLLTGNAHKVDPLAPRGLAVSQMTSQQTQLLTTLVKEYANHHRRELAQQDLAKIRRASWKKIHFSWAGGTEPGELHQYMIQGPTFMIEFDNSQDGNHIHSVWRDFEGDFGHDLLLEHYKQHHQN